MPIKISNLRKTFQGPAGPVEAVAGVTLLIPDSAFMAIVGKSGSGKSTLLSLLGALDRPTSGSIEVEGRDIAQLGDRDLMKYRAGHVGFVFQSYNLVPNLTAAQNVMLPMEFAGVPRRERAERARRLLNLAGLEEAKHGKRPGTLSGGEQQRVAIARALANRPRIVLADEPTGNLDTATGKVILDLLRRLAQSERMTVITVTHDMAIAQQADRTFEMRDGRFVRVYQVKDGKVVLDRAIVPGASALDLPQL